METEQEARKYGKLRLRGAGLEQTLALVVERKFTDEQLLEFWSYATRPNEQTVRIPMTEEMANFLHMVLDEEIEYRWATKDRYIKGSPEGVENVRFARRCEKIIQELEGLADEMKWDVWSDEG